MTQPFPSLTKYLTITTATIFLSLSNLLLPQTVEAGGSIALSELTALINQSKKLSQEIKQTLKNTNQKAENITCIGIRLGRHFGPLGAMRVAPFECQFTTNKILRIEAKNWIKLPNGKVSTAENLAVTLSENRPLPEGSVLRMRLNSWRWQKQFTD